MGLAKLKMSVALATRFIKSSENLGTFTPSKESVARSPKGPGRAGNPALEKGHGEFKPAPRGLGAYNAGAGEALAKGEGASH